MNEVGVTRQNKALVEHIQAIPFAKTGAFDVDPRLTDKSLAALFYVLEQEEKAIQTNPAAQVMDYLKEVFGK